MLFFKAFIDFFLSFFFPGFTCPSIVVYHNTFIFLSLLSFLWRWADSFHVRITLLLTSLLVHMYVCICWMTLICFNSQQIPAHLNAKVYMFLDPNFTAWHFGGTKPWWIQKTWWNHHKSKCFMLQKTWLGGQLTLLPNMHFVYLYHDYFCELIAESSFEW